MQATSLLIILLGMQVVGLFLQPVQKKRHAGLAWPVAEFLSAKDKLIGRRNRANQIAI